MAADFGLYIGLLPTWGDKVTPNWGAGPVVFDAQTAAVYGEWIGERYARDTNIIWINGGDRPPLQGDQDWLPVWRALAGGIRAGVGGPCLMTYHTPGGLDRSTSVWFHARRLARLQHHAVGARQRTRHARVGGHRPRLWLAAAEAGARRRAQLRGSPGQSLAGVGSRQRLLSGRRRAPPELSLGLCGRLRRHVWASFHLAVLRPAPRAAQPPRPLLVGGDGPARRIAHGASAPSDGEPPLLRAHPRR